MKYSILCSLFQNIWKSLTMGENNDDVEYHLIDPRICVNPTTLVYSTGYYGNVISLTGNILNFIL